MTPKVQNVMDRATGFVLIGFGLKLALGKTELKTLGSSIPVRLWRNPFIF